jgi:CheY-like chemotaxis protein
MHGQSSFQSSTFLYVEDDPPSREVIKILLKRLLGGPDLILFEHSADFMERIEALPKVPDIIFLDVDIKPDNGFELLSKLRVSAKYQRTCVIAMTVAVAFWEIADLRNAGFDGLIAKPIQIHLFVDKLRAILGGRPAWTV